MANLMNAYWWTEKVYTIRQLMERCREYMPFIVLVTEGYSGARVEITSDEIYWVQEVAKQPCLVVRNEEGRYFSVPECFKERVIPMRRVKNEVNSTPKYITIGKAMSIGELKTFSACKHFKFFEASAPMEVFEGISDGTIFDFGILEIVDVYEEKFLVGYPFMSDAKKDIARYNEQQRRGTGRIIDNCNKTGGLHPVPALIPVYVPIVLSIAVAEYKGSDYKFFKRMYDLKKASVHCDHNYEKYIAPDAEIMVFDREPVDDNYGYIEMVSLVDTLKNDKKLTAQSKSTKELKDSDSSDVSYDSVELKAMNDCYYRTEPIAYTMVMSPEYRLNKLKSVYNTGILPRPNPEIVPPKLPANYVDGVAPVIPPQELTPSHAQQKKPLEPPCICESKENVYTELEMPSCSEGRCGTESSHGDSSDSHTAAISPSTTPSKIRCMQDIPDDISEISVSDLVQCLHLLHMSHCASEIERMMVDGKLLQQLVDTDLMDTFGLRQFEARKLVQFAHGWRPKL